MYCNWGKHAPADAVAMHAPSRFTDSCHRSTWLVENLATLKLIFTFAIVVSNRFSMRQLRSSLVADTGLGTRAKRHAESVTAYNVAPKQRLDLVDIKVRKKM